jgi:hypothetical protein
MGKIILRLQKGLTAVRIERACPYAPPSKPLESRIAYAAAHVVAGDKGIDWERRSPTAVICGPMV